MASFRNNENAVHVAARPAAAGTRRPLGDRTNLNPLRSAAGKDDFSKGKAAAPPPRAASARPALPSMSRRADAGSRPKPPIEPMATPAAKRRAGGAAEDIDREGMDDPQAVAEYAEDIMRHFRTKEVIYLPPADYMEHQSDITPKMRATLIDWLVDVHVQFKLLQETLFLTVNVLDRFLAKQPQSRKSLQLVGITSMLIAAKYEEIYAPEVRDCLYICDQAYQKSEILGMERQILMAIDFQLIHPLPLLFLRRFSSAARADATVHTLAKYLIELTLPDYDSVRYLSSTIAAAGLLLALKMCGRGDAWDATMEWHTRYTESQLMPVVDHINKLHGKTDSAALKAVKKKYASSRFLSVAKMDPLRLDD